MILYIYTAKNAFIYMSHFKTEQMIVLLAENMCVCDLEN